MKIKMIGVASVLGALLAGNVAFGQAALAQKPDGVPIVDQPPLVSPLLDPFQAAKENPGKGTPPARPDRPARPEHPDTPGKAKNTDSVQDMLDRIKSEQSKFLEEQKDLQRRIKDAAKDQREKLRAEIKEKREKFLEQQKEMREEYRQRVLELKEQLKDHGDVIDQAKEQAKEKVNRRRGGDD